MKRHIVFHFDSDGVIAKWKNVSLEETFLPGFFRNMEKDPVIVTTMLLMYEQGYDVRIETAYYTQTNAKNEKKEFFNASGIGHIPAIYVPYGENKFEYVEDGNLNVLVDDFTPNLVQWREHGGLSFKYMNGVNGTNGTWTGYRIDHRMQPEEIITMLTAIAKAVA